LLDAGAQLIGLAINLIAKYLLAVDGGYRVDVVEQPSAAKPKKP